MALNDVMIHTAAASAAGTDIVAADFIDGGDVPIMMPGLPEYLCIDSAAYDQWASNLAPSSIHRRISTIGGFVTAQLGRIPRVGDEATYRNLRFRVETMRGRRVTTLRLDLLEDTQ